LRRLFFPRLVCSPPPAASRCPGRTFPISIATSEVRSARAGAPGGPPPSLRRAQRTPHRAPARPGADDRGPIPEPASPGRPDTPPCEATVPRSESEGLPGAPVARTSPPWAPSRPRRSAVRRGVRSLSLRASGPGASGRLSGWSFSRIFSCVMEVRLVAGSRDPDPSRPLKSRKPPSSSDPGHPRPLGRRPGDPGRPRWRSPGGGTRRISAPPARPR
jgi:hypothetical protein